jgi:hypothetical protein
MSIHMVGRTYSLVPEGGARSLLEIQNDLAIERSAHGAFSRLMWIRPGLQIEDERQRAIVDRLRVDPRIALDTDVLETPLEDLRTMIARRLKDGGRHARGAAGRVPGDPVSSGQLYFIYDQRDAGVIAPWENFLFEEFEVIHPVFDGDQADIRDYHEENLRTCDAALIFYGAGNECWLRRKLREIQKSAGYGRTGPMRAVGICLLAPRTPEKERFRTHQAFVIPQWDGFSPEPFQPFVCRLRDDGDPLRDEAARPA